MRRLIILILTAVVLGGCHTKKRVAGSESHVVRDSVTVTSEVKTEKSGEYWSQLMAVCSSITIRLSGDSITTAGSTVHNAAIEINIAEPAVSQEWSGKASERERGTTHVTATLAAADTTTYSEDREQVVVAKPPNLNAVFIIAAIICGAAVVITGLIRRRKMR